MKQTRHRPHRLLSRLFRTRDARELEPPEKKTATKQNILKENGTERSHMVR